MNLHSFQSVLLAVGLMAGAPTEPPQVEPVVVYGETTLEELRVIVEREVGENVPEPELGLFLVTDDLTLLTDKATAILIEGGRVDGVEVINRVESPPRDGTVGDLGEVGPTTVYLAVKLIKFWIFEITLLCRWDAEEKKEVCTVDKIVVRL
ncbi:MAG TPA: hypothetical protein VF062_25145 [Candidatus Limnocylindrales bacterium]